MNRSIDQPIARVELVIRGDMLAPDHVTTMLAISPTRSFAKGDTISSHNAGGKRPWSLWALEFAGAEVQDVVVRLLEALQGKELALRKVADMPEVHVSIAIWWDPPEGQGGFSVSSVTLAQLCALSTQIHVYFPGNTA